MKKSNIAIASILSLTVVMATSISFTLASFVNFKKINQPIGYSGKLIQKTIYFNSHIWETTDAIMGMYAFTKVNGDVTKEGWISPTKVITPTINNVTFKLYIFAVNEGEYAQFNFARLRPPTADGYNETNGGYNWTNKWNQTGDITYNLSTINYYCITGWRTTDSTDSPYSTQYLRVVNNQLVFS